MGRVGLLQDILYQYSNIVGVSLLFVLFSIDCRITPKMLNDADVNWLAKSPSSKVFGCLFLGHADWIHQGSKASSFLTRTNRESGKDVENTRWPLQVACISISMAGMCTPTLLKSHTAVGLPGA